ncbi:MAG: DUF4251 domain-containing protein [Bacteroides sp.]|nr:DUF4251 domain-containing protein [Bacteroides sp.]
MKKIITFVALLLVATLGSVSMAQDAQTTKTRKELRDEKRAQYKAEEELMNELDYRNAATAIKNQQFVVEADQLILRNGQNVFVNSGTNFLLVNKEKGTVQVAFNTALSGPNGIGGITVDGGISGMKTETDKHGNINCSFSIQGAGISAQIFVKLYYGSNEANVTISPNFNSNDLSMSGELVSIDDSTIFKGYAY